MLGLLRRPFATQGHGSAYALLCGSGLASRKGRKAAPGMLAQNAGTTAPLYFSMMNCFTSGECSAAASFFMSSESLLSGRATRMFT